MTAPGPPLVVVFNVGAGQGQADEVRATLQAGCAGAGCMLQLLEVRDPQQLGTIARQAVAQAQQCGGIVVAAGGDGTINAVAQASLGSGCAFGVLPQGTFNYFSRTHGIPSDTAEALQVLLAGHSQPAQVGLVGERVFLVNASLGLYPQLLEEREEWKRQFGRSRLVAFGAGLATLLRGHRSLRLRVESRGQERELRTPTLFVGNNALQLQQLGLPEAVDAGCLAAIALRPVGLFKMLGLLWRGAFGRLGQADELIHVATRQLTVRPSRRLGTLGSSRIKVATDGEVTWMRLPLCFRVAPQTLDLLRPPSAAPELLATE
ncbi:diacylglycerol kinase family protein [Ideonella sp. A 288]|uniref:diacylglycerol/lipid kinase family protein n=1 Tax=Ideonella sp. A 288 TaxID=1962181 RepID=UPI000B4AEB84|nr:diacylglycerol kinase family protein [Ideonella sp. A 288]